MLLAALVSLSTLVSPVMADAVEATGDAMPWPIQLGLNGVTLGALVSFFIWQNRQVSLGRWYPASIVERMLAEKDSTIADKEKQLTDQGVLIEEQRKTIRASESTADTTARALVQATSNQGWVDILVQRAIGGASAESPKAGDTTPQEVSRP